MYGSTQTSTVPERLATTRSHLFVKSLEKSSKNTQCVSGCLVSKVEPTRQYLQQGQTEYFQEGSADPICLIHSFQFYIFPVYVTMQQLQLSSMKDA